LPLTVSVFGEVLLGSGITLWPRNFIRNDAEAPFVLVVDDPLDGARPRRQGRQEVPKFDVQLIG
jgi:hypothetical protein